MGIADLLLPAVVAGLCFDAWRTQKRARAELQHIAVLRERGVEVDGVATDRVFAMKKREGQPVFTYATADGASVSAPSGSALSPALRTRAFSGETMRLLYDPAEPEWMVPVEFDAERLRRAMRGMVAMDLIASVVILVAIFHLI